MEEGLVQFVGISSGQVRATAAREEQRVAREQPLADEQALAARGVSGGVEEGDRDVADLHHIAAVVRVQRARGDTGPSA